MIVLDAKTTYVGNFVVPAKSNPDNKWLYIITVPFVSAGASGTSPMAPPPGTRVNPATDAQYMAKLVTSNTTPTLILGPGVNYVRLVGIEMYTTSTKGADPAHTNWPKNGSSWHLVNIQTASRITFDRCYLHGSDTEDLGQGIIAYQGVSYIAVIDSVISDIHGDGRDTQAFLAYGSQGPFKLVNNLFSAATEDVMFGGAGAGLPAPYNTYVPSDIEIRNNHFYKPLYWIPWTTGKWPTKWVVKNHLEFKAGHRVLVENNLFENNWNAAQGGTSIVLTVRTSQSGDYAVDDDITITNNVIKNVVAGFSTLSRDYACGRAPFTKCTNQGEARRVKIYNNLILLGDPAQLNGGRTTSIQMALGLTDWVFQHNTTVTAPGTSCWSSIFFNGRQGAKPPWTSTTTNVWVLDNVLCRPPSGDAGRGLVEYMGDPPPLDSRFLGNVMFLPDAVKVGEYPGTNVVTKTPIKYTESTEGKFALTAPAETKTSDGKPSGVDLPSLNRALSEPVVNQSAVHLENQQGDVCSGRRTALAASISAFNSRCGGPSARTNAIPRGHAVEDRFSRRTTL
jgi:hypothetical protein